MLAIDYDPLENYDRREEWLDNGVKSRTGKTSRIGSEIGNDNRNNTGNSSDTAATNTNAATTNSNTVSQSTVGTKQTDQTDDHQVSAYDSTAYQNKDKTDTDISNDDTTISLTGGSGSSDTSGITNNVETHQTSDQQTGTDSRFKNENVNDAEEEGHSDVHSGRTHGNIGVVSSQQMLTQELDVARFNLYDEAADLFLSEFCIYVY